MENMKKLLALLLCAAMVLAMLAACGSETTESAAEQDPGEVISETEETTAESQPVDVPAESEPSADEPDNAPEETDTEDASAAPVSDGGHLTIAEVAPDIPMDLPLTTDSVSFTYFTTLNPQILGYMDDLSENLYYQTAEELTGVHIDFVLASPDTQTTNFQLMIAGGDYTDIIGSEGANYVGGVEIAVEDEVYVNLLDYQEYAPHYFDLITRDEYDYASLLTDSGYMAGFAIVYTENQPLNQGYMIRQDWLDDLGLSTPETYDDWYDVLTAFGTAITARRWHSVGLTSPACLQASAFTAMYPHRPFPSMWTTAQ